MPKETKGVDPDKKVWVMDWGSRGAGVSGRCRPKPPAGFGGRDPEANAYWQTSLEN